MKYQVWNRKRVRYARFFKTLERKQSRRVRKAKESKTKTGRNYRKTQRRLNRKTKKLSNRKKDLYHKLSKTLTDTFDLIAVEDLRVANMTRSAKGTVENPGKNVSQKKGLNKAVLSASFYQFLSMISYKQTMLNGKHLVKVNPAYTSLECSRCGNRDKANRPKQDRFRCTKCGYEANPDIQASQTILRRAAQSFGTGTVLVDSKHKALRSEASASVSREASASSGGW